MKKGFVAFAISCFITTLAWGQKIIKDKNRKANEPFTIQINGTPYQQYIKDFVLTHKNYALWKQYCKDSCSKNVAASDFLATIKLLVSVNNTGKVFVYNHYSTSSNGDYVEDATVEKWVASIAKELVTIIKKKGVVYPPFKDGKYYNDEVVVENLWRYNCSSPK
jgi:hypothetical protein